ncbi:MAG: glycosyltransferase family A protein [Myxococcota bacterium]
MSDAQTQVDRYLRDQALELPDAGSLTPPRPELRACVVIPVYDELENIPDVIRSLEQASREPECFEVIVVVNNASDAPAARVQANQETIRFLRSEIVTAFDLHVLDRSSPGAAYDPDVAGVGRARREGCDLGLMRLQEVGRAEDGVLPNLDGDSPVAPRYVDDVLAEFDEQPDMLAGVCRYRHPIPDNPAHAEAIVAYETWMRYFAAALTWTETPYAFQSIGSCMALSAHGYALADGMPQLEALSDFYMLQKVAKVGGFGAVRQFTRPFVYPSARPSPRVPRGTGPSVTQRMDGGGHKFDFVEPPQAFRQLRGLFRAVRDGYDAPQVLREAGSVDILADFLDEQDAWATFDKLRDNAPSADHFERQFHTWFDSLKIVKFANDTRRELGGAWIMDALPIVLEGVGLPMLVDDIPAVDEDEATLEQRRAVLELLRTHEMALAHHPRVGG